MSAVLLDAIYAATGGDEAAAEQLAQHWRRSIRRQGELVQRIRAQPVRCVCADGGEDDERGGRRCHRCYGDRALLGGPPC
ncbi:MAG: hypothetical protein ACR2KV_09915 [Solirubrobacteraceae bacterium]